MRIPRVTLLALLLAGAASAPLHAQRVRAPSDSLALLRRALRLHQAVPMVDGHNDLAENVAGRFGGSWDSTNIAVAQPELMTDIPRLKAGRVGAQFFSVWVSPGAGARRGAVHLSLEQFDILHRMVERWPRTFAFARSAADIERAHRTGKIAVLIGVEGGHAMENSLGVLRMLYDLGARYMTLTWMNGLAWADAAGGDSIRVNGLSPFGREVVHEMNRLGMLVDLAHVTDSVMVQTLRVSQAPVIFSHSSARALADVPRDVPDTVLRMVKANGGVVMVNFYCGFVDSAWANYENRDGAARRDFRARFGADTAGARAAYAAWQAANPAPPPPDLRRVADHIDHIRQVAGIDHVGYGSDFDGINCAPRGLTDVSMFPNLTAELLRRGYSDADVKKVIGLNLLRVFRQAERVSARLRRETAPSTATLPGLDSAAARH